MGKKYKKIEGGEKKKESPSLLIITICSWLHVDVHIHETT